MHGFDFLNKLFDLTFNQSFMRRWWLLGSVHKLANTKEEIINKPRLNTALLVKFSLKLQQKAKVFENSKNYTRVIIKLDIYGRPH